ncbi:S1 family peptidase [Streptomyces sp. NBC_00448]|uniref:S1 family peptidase n=1 Tax=Streptomyces sp. NBC_00448 TaxID=2903652 RepID=UPI002E1F3B9F
MRRRIGTIVGLSALLVATALTGAGAMTASAAPAAGSRADASDAVLTAMVHDLGLTPTQAHQRLRQQAAATTLSPKARKAAGSSYGGSWFDQADGKLVVAVTDAHAAAAVAKTGATTKVVARTAEQLDAAKSAIDTLARQHKAPAGVSSWGVDLQSDQVVIDVRADQAQDAAVRAFVARAERGDTARAVTVRTTTAAAPTTLSAGTVGGDPFTSHGIRCSIGFSVIGGFVTAGHCSQQGAAVYGWDGSYVGDFQAGTFPGNDYSWVNVGSGWWTVNVVLGWGTVSDVLVHGSNVAPVGSSVCRSGSTTHWHCGTILGTNETVNYSEGSVYGLTETNVCAEPGDSGGSFISGDQAQGVTSGGYGDCTSGGETWFQPVNPILSAYGLTLQTS